MKKNGKQEWKEGVVRELGIDQHGDPFKGSGKHCMWALKKDEIQNPIKHNKACLLKERDILNKRPPITAGEFKFVKEWF